MYYFVHKFLNIWNVLFCEHSRHLGCIILDEKMRSRGFDLGCII